MSQFASTLYPQTNPTNPILLEVREYLTGRLGIAAPVASAFLEAWEQLFCVRFATPSQRKHARRVLERLANFTG